MDGADRDARLEAVEAENEHLRETVRELSQRRRARVWIIYSGPGSRGLCWEFE